MNTAPATEEERQNVRLSVYMTAEMRERIGEIAEARGTTEGTTARWLLDHAIEWYDALTEAQQVIA